MSTKNHAALTGSDLHEPKGAASASSGQVYVADGAGTGAWTTPKTSYVILAGRWDDISTAETIYLPVPVAGTIKKIYVSLQNAITTADSALTFTINGVAITGSAITAAQSGSAAGTVFSSSPSGLNTVAAGQYVSCVTDGGSSTTSKAWVFVLVQVS
jgi:hypothetical protein